MEFRVDAINFLNLRAHPTPFNVDSLLSSSAFHLQTLVEIYIYIYIYIQKKLQKKKEKVSFPGKEEHVFTPQSKATALASFHLAIPLKLFSLQPWRHFISPPSFSSSFSSNPSILFHLLPFPFLGFVEIHSLSSMLLSMAMRRLSMAAVLSVSLLRSLPVLGESCTRNPSDSFEVNRGD